MTQVGADAKLPEKERDYLTRSCLTRTVVLLRDAIDGSPKLSDTIKEDLDIKVLESRPDFQAILRTLVDSGRPK